MLVLKSRCLPLWSGRANTCILVFLVELLEANKITAICLCSHIFLAFFSCLLLVMIIISDDSGVTSLEGQAHPVQVFSFFTWLTSYPLAMLNAFLFSQILTLAGVHCFINIIAVTLTFASAKSLMSNSCLNLCYDFLLFVCI